MAARLQALASKAKAAAEPLWARARSETLKQYDAVMAKNAEYVVKDKEAADKLLKQYVFTQMSRCAAGGRQGRGWNLLLGCLLLN